MTVVQRTAVLLVIGYVSTLAAAPASAQDAPVVTPTVSVLSDLRSAYLTAAGTTGDSVMVETLAEIQAALTRMEDTYVATGGEELSGDYVAGLRANAWLLRRAATNEDSAAAIIADVASDLQWKAYDVAAGVGWSTEARESGIEVTVRVRRNGSDVGGYYARANPRRFPPSPNPLFPFTNETPSTRRLPSGNYIVWIEDVNGQIMQARPLTISSVDDPEIIFVIQ